MTQRESFMEKTIYEVFELQNEETLKIIHKKMHKENMSINKLYKKADFCLKAGLIATAVVMPLMFIINTFVLDTRILLNLALTFSSFIVLYVLTFLLFDYYSNVIDAKDMYVKKLEKLIENPVDY